MYDLLSEVGGLNLRENTDENVKVSMCIERIQGVPIV